MTKDEALDLALEALLRSRKAVAGDYDLASCAYGSNDPDGHRYQNAKKTVESVKEAITAIKQALAAPVQEPVAWMTQARNFVQLIAFTEEEAKLYGWTPVYTTPPAAQRQWVGLTDEQIKTIDETALTKNMAIAMTMATLKEKNT